MVAMVAPELTDPSATTRTADLAMSETASIVATPIG